MEAKNLLIISISFVVLVIAILYLASSIPTGTPTWVTSRQKPQPTQVGYLQMVTPYVNVVEGVPNQVKIYFKNNDDTPITNFEATIGDSKYYEVKQEGDYIVLYLDDTLIRNEVDHADFTLTPEGIHDFTLNIDVSYNLGCEKGAHCPDGCEPTKCDNPKVYHQSFPLHVRVNDGMVLKTTSVRFIPGEKNEVEVCFKNIGRLALRGFYTTVEAPMTGYKFDQCDHMTLENGPILDSGEEDCMKFETSAPEKPDHLTLTVHYRILDEERVKTFEVNTTE